MSKIIGFSTGCLVNAGLGINEAINLYAGIKNLNAIEISFANSYELLDFNLNKNIEELIQNFNYVTLHAPWKTRAGKFIYRQDSDEVKDVIQKLVYLNDQLPLSGIVIHPDIIHSYEILSKVKLPLLIENMDLRKSLGTHPSYFKELKKKSDYGFVLDIEHVYEHDNQMNLIDDFLLAMGDNLRELHLSGCHSSGKRHLPVYDSDNKPIIIKALRKIDPNVPVILEGKLKSSCEAMLLKELEFVKSIYSGL